MSLPPPLAEARAAADAAPAASLPFLPIDQFPLIAAVFSCPPPSTVAAAFADLVPAVDATEAEAPPAYCLGLSESGLRAPVDEVSAPPVREDAVACAIDDVIEAIEAAPGLDEEDAMSLDADAC